MSQSVLYLITNVANAYDTPKLLANYPLLKIQAAMNPFRNFLQFSISQTDT